MADWVIVVDDDETNLKLAGRILSMKGMRVTAFKSGKALLHYLEINPMPDLILLDIMMPEMNGYETLKRLHMIERARKVPVIFLTGDETVGAEARGLSLGAMDFIKKPFIPEVLVLRVRHIIELDHLHKQLATEVVKKTEEANTDAMTGLLNKKASEEEIARAVAEKDGMIAILDLDSFKLVNDLHGHDMGDKVLIRFSELLRSQLREGDVVGRIGGDEFIIFCPNVWDEEAMAGKTRFLNEALKAAARELMGAGDEIPLGVSVGAARVSDGARDYEEVRKMADQALYQVKLGGKHGCKVFGGAKPRIKEDKLGFAGIETLFGERNPAKGAMVVASEQFRLLYRYLVRFSKNYPYDIRLVVVTLRGKEGPAEAGVVERFVGLAAEALRASDVILCQSEDKALMLLPKVNEENWMIPVQRVFDRWKEKGDPEVEVACDSTGLG